MKFKIIFFLVFMGITPAHAKGMIGAKIGDLIGNTIGHIVGKDIGNTLSEHRDVNANDLVIVAEQKNKQLPLSIDNLTSLDRVVAGPGLHFTYKYTLTTITSKNIDRNLIVNATQEQRQHLLTRCSNPKNNSFPQKGGSESYSYQTSDGLFITKIDITPQDCGYYGIQAVNKSSQAIPSSIGANQDAGQAANDLYREGRYEEALPLVRQLAEQNKADWQGFLGGMYEYGQGVPRDENLALYWYHLAEKQGSASAGLARKKLMENQAQQTQARLDAQAKAQSQAKAQVRLEAKAQAQARLEAKVQARLDAQARDEANEQFEAQARLEAQAQEATRLQTKFLENIDRRAYDLYSQGRYSEALPLYQQTANQGDASAQLNLGIMYHNGQGVTADINQAAYWYRKAAEQGVEAAIKVMSEIDQSAKNKHPQQQKQDREEPLFTRESYEAEVRRQSKAAGYVQ